MFKNYASENTPVTKNYWRNLTDEQRVNAINKIKNNNDSLKNISINRAHENGQVFVILSEGSFPPCFCPIPSPIEFKGERVM